MKTQDWLLLGGAAIVGLSAYKAMTGKDLLGELGKGLGYSVGSGAVSAVVGTGQGLLQGILSPFTAPIQEQVSTWTPEQRRAFNYGFSTFNPLARLTGISF